MQVPYSSSEGKPAVKKRMMVWFIVLVAVVFVAMEFLADFEMILLSGSTIAFTMANTTIKLSMETSSANRTTKLRSNSANTLTTEDTLTPEQWNTSISLVTSFWAQPDNETSHPHRKEIEAALVVNAKNPYITQVVVVLDGVSPAANCSHFVKKWAAQNVSFTCLDRPDSQPTYRDMFTYTLHPAVIGRAVILCNADMAFDETVKLAGHVQPQALLVLSTMGFSVSDPNIAATLRQQYQESTNAKKINMKSPGYCAKGGTSKGSMSWDAYIFAKDAFPPEFQFPNGTFFRKSQPRGWPESRHYFMNEMGAENAALHDVKQFANFTKIFNACLQIHMYNFHLEQKMHHSVKGIFVPKPASMSFKYWNNQSGVLDYALSE